jgi:hypothetical protein
LLEKPTPVRFQDSGNPFFGKGFHESVFTILVAEREDLHAAGDCGCSANPQTDDASGTSDIQGRENDQEYEYHPSEVPNVLRAEATELDAFVYAFVDLINAVVHGF